MKHLTLFETSAAYNAATLDLPNVSVIKENMGVTYNPYVPETRLIAKFNVTDTSSPTQLCYSNAVSQFSAIEIDGVVQLSTVTTYTFDTVGEHTVKYTLTDPTSIGTSAFAGCSDLTSVNIPNSVTSIGNKTFKQCSSLTSITIGNSVTNIGNEVFGNCTNLTSATIGNSVTSIGAAAFYNCTNLTSVTIGNSVTSIEAATFYNCTNLTSVTIGNSVTGIEEDAFRNCTRLTSVNIPNSVTSIGSGVFSYCSGLTSIISNAMTAPTIANSTFRDVKTGGTLTVPTGSTGYDVWMGTGNYYLGKYNWTKVEQ